MPEPPAEPAVWQVGNVHHIGRRSYQQDAFGVSALGDEQLVRECGVLAVLADGMGGMNNSGELSQAVVRTVLNAFGRVRGEQSETLTQMMRLAFDAAQNSSPGAGLGLDADSGERSRQHAGFRFHRRQPYRALARRRADYAEPRATVSARSFAGRRRWGSRRGSRWRPTPSAPR